MNGVSVSAGQPANDTLGFLWRGHVYLFDRPTAEQTYSERTGTRLLLMVVTLEAFRLATAPFFGLWLQSSVYLIAALVCVPAFVGLSLRDLGIRPWRDWNLIEKSYFVQVMIIANAVFLMMLGAKLAQAFSDRSASSVILMTFVPYLLTGFRQEVIYRGMLQTELVRRWGPLTGIPISNALYTFGPQHYYYFGSRPSLAFPMFAAIFTMGLVFAMVYRRSGNLWIVGIMHAIGNAYMATAIGGIR
jgi:CAAX protease family protein